MDRATSERRILISADTDFGELLAESGATVPSVILLRRERNRTAANQATLLLATLGTVATEPESGAIVVLEATRLRVRARFLSDQIRDDRASELWHRLARSSSPRWAD